MATKALLLPCLISLLLVISSSVTTAQARISPGGFVPTLLDMAEEEILVIRSYVRPKAPPSPRRPPPHTPAKDSIGPVLPQPPGVDELISKY